MQDGVAADQVAWSDHKPHSQCDYRVCDVLQCIGCEVKSSVIAAVKQQVVDDAGDHDHHHGIQAKHLEPLAAAVRVGQYRRARKGE